MKNYVKNRFLSMVSLLFLSILICFLFMSPGVTPVDIDIGQIIAQAAPLSVDLVETDCLNDNAVNYPCNFAKRLPDHQVKTSAVCASCHYSDGDIGTLEPGTVLKYPIL